MLELPEQLLLSLRGIEGFDEQSFLAAHAESPATTIRKHPLKGVGSDLAGQQVSWSSGGIYLETRPVFTLDPAYHAGAYYVQEASSMFLEHIWRTSIDNGRALNVLDLCAAPGGKSTLLASLITDDSLLISNEVIRTRASILEENVTRWGYANNWVTCNDPRDFSGINGFFDVVVIDAPCSGSGLFRKDPRALSEWSEANVALCGNRQERILADIWPSLKEGGIIIYATCSFSPREDEAILDWLAAEYDVASIAIPTPKEWGIVETESPIGQLKGYRFFPGKAAGEGFFVAAIRKQEAQTSLKLPKFRQQKTLGIAEHVIPFLAAKPWQILSTGKESYSAIHPAHEEFLAILEKSLYFRKIGLPVGAPAAKEWLPAHDIALAIDASAAIPSIPLNKDQALRFLKREDFEHSGADKGWRMVRYNGLGLGWVKLLGSRINNYLPKHWRIRMQLPDEDNG